MSDHEITTDTLPPPEVLNMDELSGTIWSKLDALGCSTALPERFPRFMACFESLYAAIKQTFACGIDVVVASKADIAVYGLGRLCLEDFTEIVFLVEHDYGYAAVKLLRGLYERAVVNQVIVENPGEEGTRFYDYYTVEERKFNRRAGSIYEGWDDDPSGIKKFYDQNKDAYKYEPCEECHQTPQQSWSKYSLVDLAGNLGKATNDLALQGLGKELRDLYLTCALVPNKYIHASISSILQRITERPDGFVFDPASYALTYAHLLILLALDTQNQYFKLKMEQVLEPLYRDRDKAWSVTPTMAETPTVG